MLTITYLHSFAKIVFALSLGVLVCSLAATSLSRKDFYLKWLQAKEECRSASEAKQAYADAFADFKVSQGFMKKYFGIFLTRLYKEPNTELCNSSILEYVEANDPLRMALEFVTQYKANFTLWVHVAAFITIVFFAVIVIIPFMAKREKINFDLQSQNKDLAIKVEDLEKAMALAIKQKDDQQKEYECNLINCKEEEAKLRREKADLEALVSEHNARQLEHELTRQQLEDKINHLEEQLQEKSSKNINLSSQVSESTRQVAAIQNYFSVQVSNARQQSKTLQNENETLTQQVDFLKKQNEAYEKAHVELLKHVSELTEDVLWHQEEDLRNQKRVDNLQHNLNDKSRKLETMDVAVNQLVKENENLVSSVLNETTAKDKLDDEITNHYQPKISSLLEELKQLEKELGDSKVRVSGLEERVSQLNSESDEQKEKIILLKKENDSMVESNKSLPDDVQKLQAELRISRMEAVDAKVLASGLLKNVKRLNAECASRNAVIREKEEEISNLRRQNATLSSQKDMLEVAYKT